MDTTPKYIKMCEKAEEIQPKKIFIFNYDSGSFFYHKRAKAVVTNKGTLFEEGDVFLPRQDQLQEMVLGDRDIWELHLDYDEFLFTFERDCPSRNVAGLLSAEQFWLAFVMKEKFNKMWDDKEEIWT